MFRERLRRTSWAGSLARCGSRSTPSSVRIVRAALLGYRPNRTAQNLRVSRTGTLGVITDIVGSGLFANKILAGASAAARMSDHILVIGDTEGDPEVEARLIEEMIERRVDGLLYATLETSEVSVNDGLASTNAVLLNCIDRTWSAPSVLPDEFEGGRTAGALILEATNGQHVYVLGNSARPGALAGRWRMNGLTSAFAERGLALAGQIGCEWSPQLAFTALSELLSSGAEICGPREPSSGETRVPMSITTGRSW